MQRSDVIFTSLSPITVCKVGYPLRTSALSMTSSWIRLAEWIISLTMATVHWSREQANPPSEPRPRFLATCLLHVLAIRSAITGRTAFPPPRENKDRLLARKLGCHVHNSYRKRVKIEDLSSTSEPHSDQPALTSETDSLVRPPRAHEQNWLRGEIWGNGSAAKRCATFGDDLRIIWRRPTWVRYGGPRECGGSLRPQAGQQRREDEKQSTQEPQEVDECSLSRGGR